MNINIKDTFKITTRSLFVILINLTLTVLFSCTRNNVSDSFENDYQETRGLLNKRFVDHFPRKRNETGKESSMFSSSNERKNDFNLVLYLYKVNKYTIDSLLKNIGGRAIANYKLSDSCLLIVNRFETQSSKDSLESPTITDSTLINRSCYDNKYPIPILSARIKMN